MGKLDWGVLFGLSEPVQPQEGPPDWVTGKLKADARKQDRQKTRCGFCNHARSGHNNSRGKCHRKPMVHGYIVYCICLKFVEPETPEEPCLSYPW